MHRLGGVTTDINTEATRAVSMMKATITQRFVIDGCEVDAESDCRFCYFWEKCDGRWGARFVRHWYEKDKLIPVDPRKVPKLNDEKLKELPYGYRYLGYCQEETMGVKVVPDMPGHMREGDNANGKMHDMLYSLCKKWLDGDKLVI